MSGSTTTVNEPGSSFGGSPSTRIASAYGSAADAATGKEDQRFSVAVAAFGQKLRDADAVAGMGWDRIADIAAAARGSDPFGYRSEFLSLVRLASALSGAGK